MRRIISSHLTQVTFNSAALSGTAVVSHPLACCGEWQVLPSLGCSPLQPQTVLVLSKGGRAMVAIEPDGALEHQLLRGGHMRLRAVDHADFAVQLSRSNDDAPEWNSRFLQEGDYFSCLPLRPGRYRLANLLSSVGADVVVLYPDPRLSRDPTRHMEPVHVRAGEQFSPRVVELFPGQPLIVAIASPAHLMLTLESPDNGPSDLAAWRERRDAEALAALGKRDDGAST